MYQTVKPIISATIGREITASALVQMPVSVTEVDVVVVSWSLLDFSGIEYASGFAFTTELSDEHTTAIAHISLPNTLEVVDSGTVYQLKWVFDFDGSDDLLYFESFLVFPSVTDPFGPQDAVEIYGNSTVELLSVLPIGDVETANVTIYDDDNVLLYTESGVASFEGGNDKYRFKASVDLVVTRLTPSLVPYTVIWDYRVNNVPQQEVGRLFVVTPSILSAQKELSDWINRLHTSTGLAEAQYTLVDMLGFLKSGTDYFNSLDQITNFTMTRAKGPITHFWLTASKAVALRSQYLVEGEKSFDFGGQAISLSVDITQYLSDQLSNAEAYLADNVQRFKRQAKKKGITGGDGSENVSANARRIGAAGISLSPVSTVRRFI